MTSQLLHYEWVGGRRADAPVLVGLHGALNTGWNSFRHCAPLVGRSFNFLLYDRSGNGRSFSPQRRRWSDEYHLEDARELISLCEQLRIEQCYLVGNSDGCVIALLAAAMAPKLVAGVVLCGGTHVWSTPPEGEQMDWASMRETVASNPVLTNMSKLEEYHGSMEKALVVRDRWLDWWVGKPDGPPTAHTIGWDVRGHLQHVRCPVLAIHGLLDWDVTHGEEHIREVVGLLPNARLVIEEGVGHTPQAECPELVARHLEAFHKERVDHKASRL
eukprot:TRINITY_DN35518_c0_g1_i1.p1 TRINITY_DN35518_c0_g1~~TRINITY_DN35518_c0_g1_i1.p1  ORF type:complete len:273 (-),score=21.83 TRINITY_DN35518_c0_g1_i1:578-1396(-)